MSVKVLLFKMDQPEFPPTWHNLLGSMVKVLDDPSKATATSQAYSTVSEVICTCPRSKGQAMLSVMRPQHEI